MSTRKQRIDVFRDTQDWIFEDPDLFAALDAAKQNTEVFFEEDYPMFDARKKKQNTEITVTRDKSFQAAMRLHKEKPYTKIAVMNFANAFHPGGGVTSGCTAQEESLCRISTLYPLLARPSLKQSYYKYHNDLNSVKATDALIYTEGVVICKTDDDLPVRMPKEDWVTVDVITIAAPDLRKYKNPHVPISKGGSYMSKAELFACHVKRAIHMLTCAASKNADVLVLGAFGCGAFENDPQVVARAYKTALEEFPKVFMKVEFAVYCSEEDSRNYDIFKEILEEK